MTSEARPLADPSIGVVGLGIMGTAYAKNLLSGGFRVVGTDVDVSRMSALEDLGGHPVRSAEAVADQSDIVLVALPSVEALEEVVSGARGLRQAARPGLVVVEMSTLPLTAKVEARQSLGEAGAETLDAPVSGTGLQADARDIVVYASGGAGALATARPVLDSIARETFDLGDFGNGSKMKYVANLLVSVHNLATAEAFVLGIKGGLDPGTILEVISAGVGSSRIFEIRGPMIVDDDYPPAARLRMFLKDIAIISQFGADAGAATPLLTASLPWYERAVEAGLGDLDAAALARLLMDEANLEL